MPAPVTAVPPPLAILHADASIAVVDKPAGVLAHESRLAARETDTLLARAQVALGRPAWLAHRLDRATSGCLLLGLDRAVMPLLGAGFMERRVDKRYLAIVRGWPPESGSIEHALDGGPGKPEPRAAVTHYRCVARGELSIAVPPHGSARYALLECRPETGRYRQIRRHLKHLSHHLIGDTSHGDGRHNRVFRQHLGVHRMLLHAWRLSFQHPLHGGRIEVSAPLDAEFTRALERLGWLAAWRAFAAAGDVELPAQPGPTAAVG